MQISTSELGFLIETLAEKLADDIVAKAAHPQRFWPWPNKAAFDIEAIAQHIRDRRWLEEFRRGHLNLSVNDIKQIASYLDNALAQVSELVSSLGKEQPLDSAETLKRGSVLQGWVMQLPLREQGTLLTAVRGCDLTPKLPLDSPERTLVACIRGAFMVPANPRELDYEPGCFMSAKAPPDFKPSAFGHYPLHWVAHVMHASEVIAYRHPMNSVRLNWVKVYQTFAHSMHVPPERFSDYVERMSEDRIAKGTVVS
jgi:hypothetical protein